jgi:hypothetical protein
MDLTSFSDRGHERWVNFLAEFSHLTQGELECRRHFESGQISRGEYKFADAIHLERLPFKKVVADAFVSSEQDPAVCPDCRQPNFVRGSAFKMA